MMSKEDYIRKTLEESLELKKKFFQENISKILKLYDWICEAASNDCQVLIFGNGGSAADAQHFAAELMHRVETRPIGIRAMALHTDTSLITAVANDEGFDRVFARQLEVLLRPGDLAIGISTSGNSPNILEALKVARASECRTVGFLGRDGGSAAEWCDLPLIVPHASTPRIQEVHGIMIHVVCQLLEQYNSS